MCDFLLLKAKVKSGAINLNTYPPNLHHFAFGAVLIIEPNVKPESILFAR